VHIVLWYKAIIIAFHSSLRLPLILYYIIIIITLKLCSPTLTVKTVTSVLIRIICSNAVMWSETVGLRTRLV